MSRPTQRETARGDGYPYLDNPQPQPSAPPPLHRSDRNDTNHNHSQHSSRSDSAAAPPPPPSGRPSPSAPSAPPSSLTSSWMSLDAALRNNRAEPMYPSISLSPSTDDSARSTSSSSSAAPASTPPLRVLPAFAQSPAQRPPPSSSAVPNLYAPLPARSSPLKTAASAASLVAASALGRVASALHSALPHPQPSTSMQIIDAYHAARRHKTMQRYVYATAMLTAPLVILLCSLLLDAPAPVQAVCDLLHLRPALLRYPLWLLCAGMWVAGCVALYRFYAPLPSLQGVSHRQRQLMGLPYDADLLAQETVAAPPPAATTAAEGLRKRNSLAQAALSSLAETAMSTSTSARRPLPASTSPFPALSATSSITPMKGGAWSSYGDTSMTDAKELQRFIAATDQPVLMQTPPPSSASSFYSPYRSPAGLGSYGSGVGHTPPYATSVRTTSTLVRGGSTHSGGLRSGRYALDDPRADSESAERANEVLHPHSIALFIELGISNAIDVWSRNMKQWLHSVVLQPLARDLETTRQEMTFLASQVLQAPSVQLRDEERSLLRSIDRSPTAAFDFLLDRFPSRFECERWRQLAKYVRVRPHSPSTSSSSPPSDAHSSTHYTFHRLLQLGQRDGLSVYLWNAGFSTWSPSLPSDAALVCHAFWTFLTDFHPLVVATHFVDEGDVGVGEGRAKGRKAGVVMHQCRPWTLPPYYLLMVEVEAPGAAAGGKAGAEEVREWRCEPGRSNLFQALALLVWFIKTRAGGRVGSIRLKDRALEGLEQVVD